MITIEFIRYVPTLDVESTENNVNKNVFIKIKDSDLYLSETETIIKARENANRWLQDHYGEVVIKVSNIEDTHTELLDNYKKMIDFFNNCGLHIILR